MATFDKPGPTKYRSSNEKPLLQVTSSSSLLQTPWHKSHPVSLQVQLRQIIHCISQRVLESNDAKSMKRMREFACASSEYEAFETQNPVQSNTLQLQTRKRHFELQAGQHRNDPCQSSPPFCQTHKYYISSSLNMRL